MKLSGTHCPRCRQKLLQKGDDGRVRVRNRILIIDGDQAVVVCRCGAEVALDLKMGETLRKALAVPRLLLRPSEKPIENS